MVTDEVLKKQNPKGGRKPSILLTNELLEQISKLASQGLSQKMVAYYLGVSLPCWHQKKKKHPEMREAYVRGRGQGVAFVSGRLMGFIEHGTPAVAMDATKYYLSRVGEFTETIVDDEEDQEDNSKKVHKPLKIPTKDPIEAARIYQQIMQTNKPT